MEELFGSGEDRFAKGRPPTKAYIVSREEWRGVPARGWMQLKLPINQVSFTVDTETPACTTPDECAAIVRGIQDKHMNQDHLPDIAYNFLVGGDGNIYEGRGWFAKPQKALLEPECLNRTIDIAYIGKYGFPDEQYPWALYETACELMLEGQDRKLMVVDLKLLFPEEANN